MTLLPEEMPLDILVDMVAAACAATCIHEYDTDTISTAFLEQLTDELEGGKLIVMAAPVARLCIFCNKDITWDDDSSPQCIPSCSP